MGYSKALDLIDYLGDEDLAKAVSIHFVSNCYPPVPNKMLSTALKAIENCATENPEELIQLPEGVSYKGSTEVSSWDVVEGLHLDAFVDFLYNMGFYEDGEDDE
jgi:hypothetical protein